MKLLKISNDVGYFLDKNNKFKPIDSITKDDLLHLVNLILTGELDFDEYDEEKIKNQAHQIVYKSIQEKLQSFIDRRQEFIDESERIYLTEYEKYKHETSEIIENKDELS